MAIPAFLGSSFFYLERTGVVDVQTIIDDFQAQVLANVPVWTNPSTGVYVSPVDGFGRSFKLVFTRGNAQSLYVVIVDQNEITIATRMIMIPSTNATHVRIYTGQFHFAIDCNTITTSPEFICGGILDISPEPQNAHSRYVWAMGPRTAPNSYNEYYWGYAVMLDNLYPSNAARINWYLADYINAIAVIDSMGYWITQPLMLYVNAGSSPNRYAGRIYQMVFISKIAGGGGTEIILPVDAGVTGKFKILSGPGNISNPANGWVVAVRIE